MGSPDTIRRALVTRVLVLISIARFSLSCLAVVSVEAYWTTQPIRPDVTYSLFIMWAFVELPLAVWLWFPRYLGWFAVLANDLLATLGLVQLLMFYDSDPIRMTLGLPFLLNVVRGAILLRSETREIYQISLPP